MKRTIIVLILIGFLVLGTFFLSEEIHESVPQKHVEFSEGEILGDPGFESSTSNGGGYGGGGGGAPG